MTAADSDTDQPLVNSEEKKRTARSRSKCCIEQWERRLRSAASILNRRMQNDGWSPRGEREAAKDSPRLARMTSQALPPVLIGRLLRSKHSC